MGIPGQLLPHRVEQGLVSSLLPRPTLLQEESGPVRREKVQKKNLLRSPLLHKNGILASIGMDDPAKVSASQLTGPFSEPSPAREASLRADRPLC